MDEEDLDEENEDIEDDEDSQGLGEGDGQGYISKEGSSSKPKCPKCKKVLKDEEVVGNLFAGIAKTVFTFGAGYERILPTRKKCPKCGKWWKVIAPGIRPKEDWVHNYFFSNIFTRGTKN